MKIQSVIIDKRIFTKRRADNYIKKNNYVNKKVDITKNFYRYRQFEPRKTYKYRMKDLGNGVKLVLKIN
jgi:hypothetical protein